MSAKIKSIPNDILTDLLAFLSRNEIEKCQLISTKWSSFLVKKLCSLPLRKFKELNIYSHYVSPNEVLNKGLPRPQISADVRRNKKENKKIELELSDQRITESLGSVVFESLNAYIYELNENTIRMALFEFLETLSRT